MHTIQNFLCHNHILVNIAVTNKPKLVGGDNVIHVLLKSVDNDFAENFIDRIAQSNRSKLSNILMILQLRNRKNINEVNFRQVNIFLPDLVNESRDILTSMLQGVLVETRWESVRTRRLPSCHIK